MNKKIVISLIITHIISLLYLFIETNYLLAFTDALGFFAIASILISGFIFLDRFGYFDVFGYTFKKTYFVLTNKYGELEADEKERFTSMYDYAQFKNSRRQQPTHSFYIYTLIILIEDVLFNLIYIYL